MAKDVERMIVELSADVSRLERGMKAGQAIVDRRTRAIERSFDSMNKRTSRSVSDMGNNIRNAIAGIALGAAVREVQQYADAWTRMGNPLRAAGMSQEAVNSKMDEMVNISLRTRSSLEGTVSLYTRLVAASGNLGVSQERVARVVETVNKAFATSMMTGGERTSAMTQLAQGLGSGTLAGDELKAIRENSVVLAQAIADEFDTTIGGLKKLGEEGELTSARVFAAIEKAQSGVDSAFAKTTATIGESFTNLQTRAMQYIGGLDQATGASEKFAAAVGFVANNLDAFGDAAVVAATVVGGALAGRAMVAALTAFASLQASVALTNAQLTAFEIRAGLATGALGRMSVAGVAGAGAMRALSGAMAFVGGPIGLAVIALAAGVMLLARNSAEAERRADELRSTMAGAKDAMEAFEEASRAAANANKDNAEASRAAEAAARMEALSRLQAAQATAVQTAELAKQRAERARAQAQIARGPLSGLGGSNLTPGQAGLSAVGLAQQAQQAEREAKAATDGAKAAQEAYERIVSTRASGGYVNTYRPSAAADDDKAKKASGPSAAEIAAMREQLRLQGELDLAQARGDEAEERRIQRLIDINSLTEQMVRARIDGAEALATAQIDSVIAAENLQKEIDKLVAASEKRTEARIAAEQALSDEMDRQLQVQIDLARIEGNDRVVLMLERELQLRQALSALGPNATPEQRAAVTADEAMLNRAEDRAILTEQGQDMARTFVDVLRAEDIGTEIGNRFRQAAFDKLEEVLGNLFSQIMAPQAGGGGGGIFGAIASGIGSLFGGNRALNGPVKAGKFYKINENTPNSEYFAPTQDGYVGNMKPAKAQASRGPVQMTFRTEYNLQGAAGTEAILSTVHRMQAASERRILTTVQAAAPNAQLEQRLLKE